MSERYQQVGDEWLSREIESMRPASEDEGCPYYSAFRELQARRASLSHKEALDECARLEEELRLKSEELEELRAAVRWMAGWNFGDLPESFDEIALINSTTAEDKRHAKVLWQTMTEEAWKE